MRTYCEKKTTNGRKTSVWGAQQAVGGVEFKSSKKKESRDDGVDENSPGHHFKSAILDQLHVETQLELEAYIAGISHFVVWFRLGGGSQNLVADLALLLANDVHLALNAKQHGDGLDEEEEVDDGATKAETQNHPPMGTGRSGARHGEEEEALPDQVRHGDALGSRLLVLHSALLLFRHVLQRLEVRLQLPERRRLAHRLHYFAGPNLVRWKIDVWSCRWGPFIGGKVGTWKSTVVTSAAGRGFLISDEPWNRLDFFNGCDYFIPWI